MWEEGWEEDEKLTRRTDNGEILMMAKREVIMTCPMPTGPSEIG